MDTPSSSHQASGEHSDSGHVMSDAAAVMNGNKLERKTLIITEKKEKVLSLKIRWYVYVSHFLSAWGDRMWQFGVGLFLVIISPDSLLVTAVYGFVTGGSVLLFGTMVGDWIDRTARLRAARITLVVQNLSVVVCSVVLYFVITYKAEIAAYWDNSGLLTLSYVIIITMAAIAMLASTGTTIAVERDWIVEICEKDTELLAATSARLKTIDLITKIVAPIVIGQIMYFTSENIGALFIGGWNLVSVVVEYYLLWKVHELVPRLRDKKLGSDGDGQEREPESRCTSCLRSVFSGFLILAKGWRTYMKYEVAYAGIGLSFLFMTVLGFDNITVGFAYTQGINESIMGALMGAGALFGILGTVIYPPIRRRFGLERSGLFGLSSQVLLLSLCVLSVWAPGSPFDPLTRSRNREQPGTIHAENSTTAINSTHWNRANQPNALNYSDTEEGVPNDIYGNMSSSGVVKMGFSNQLIGEQETETPVKTSTETEDQGWRSYLSIGLLILGIIGARCGLWIADLTINQLFLESVLDSERGIVLGVQTSLNQLMDMLKFVMVMVAPEPELFGILVLISFLFVCVGWAFYAKFSHSVRKHLFHFDKLLTCGKTPQKGYESFT